MNDELKSKALEIITSLQELAREGATQLPDMAQSYILYGRVTSLASCLVLLVAFAFFSWRLEKAFTSPRMCPYTPTMWSDGQIAEATLYGCVLAVSGALGMQGAKGAALVWLAPKVWLIKELAGLIK